MSNARSDSTPETIATALVVVCVGLATAGVLGWAGAPGVHPADDPAATASIDPGNETIEDEYVEPAPERGDEYFEAAAQDGSWISYVNPRDRYRSPYLGDGSGKICVALLNEAGEVVVGESVPGTTVTVPTGDSIAWHADADPMTVEYPLTANYERPLDSDQFGTTPGLPQGDGYMDAHCIEVHGLPEDGGTVEYGPAEVRGEYADWIDVVGYVQQANVPGWDTSVDPIADAEPYDEVGGWTYRTDASHGQVVVVLQLDPPESAYPDDGLADDGLADDGSTHWSALPDAPRPPDLGLEDGTGADSAGSADDAGSVDGPDGGAADGGVSDVDDGASDDGAESTADPDDDGSPGFGVLVALVAISLAALARAVR